MLINDIPIRQKLMRMMILINGIVLLVTCGTFFIYEIHSFRTRTIEQLSTIGKIVSTNSIDALIIDNANNANEILAALKAEPRIVSACLYDENGKLFSHYPSNIAIETFPLTPELEGYHFFDLNIEGFQYVMKGDEIVGTLYLKSDLGAMYERLGIYSLVTVIVMSISILLTYLLSRILQKSISKPILVLAEMAKVISNRKDYSVRATKLGNDELGALTDAFNQMLIQIELQNQSLSEFNKNLEAKIKERTIELIRSNADLEQFAYVASHDLQEPLRTVTSHVHILSKRYTDKLDQDANKLIEFVIDGSNRMRNVINSLLEYSRVNRIKPFEPIDMNFLLTEVLDNLREAIKENKAKVKTDELPNIFGDTVLINQLFQNLIANAIKFKGDKTPEISISGKKVNNEYLFSVKDNGIGIRKEYSDKIFIIFQRLHTKDEYQGTGIGLAICKKIIERHGGKIWLESELGMGSTFYFTLKAN